MWSTSFGTVASPGPCQENVKVCDIISTYSQQQHANACLQFCSPDRGMGARFILHLCASDYIVIWLRQTSYTGHLKEEDGTAGSGFRITSGWDKFMRAGLNACCDSGFPPHSSGCWNIYELHSLMSWKKEIMTYKTADCRKNSSSFGGLELFPLTCRDRLSLSDLEMTAVRDFICLMKCE